MVALTDQQVASIRALCQRHRVRRLFLIGSATGSAFDPARSDLDFLVEFEPHERGGFDDERFQLHAALEASLGRSVDLLEARTIRNPYLIASINRQKQMLYAA